MQNCPRLTDWSVLAGKWFQRMELSGVLTLPDFASFTVSELVCVYKDDVVYPLTRKNLRKLFPTRKDEIDAFFKSGEKLPETVPGALDFLSRWAD